MKCAGAKFVPQLLLPEQKERRAAVANEFVQTATNEAEFLKVITGGEWWVYGCDLETKTQSSQWKSTPGFPHLKKVWQSGSKI